MASFQDDELFDEKKKILFLGDQAAFEQQSEVTQQKNQELIDHLKVQNTEIRKRLIDLKRENLSEHHNVSAEQKGRLQTQLMRHRKTLDEQVTSKTLKEKEKRILSEQLRELEQMAPVSDSAAKRRIRSLENQLDKIILKYNESQSIKKTYEQIIKRLNEERANFDNQLELMEETMKQKNEDYAELLLMQKAARSSRDVAKDELKQVKQELQRDQKEFERVLDDKRIVLERKIRTRDKKEEEERERQRIQAQLQRERDGMGATQDGFGDTSFSGTGQPNNTLLRRYALATGGATTQQQIELMQEKLAKDEASFRKIKEATGDDDINKVIQKFQVQAEYQKECDARRKATEKRLDQAKQQRAEAAHELEEANAAGIERIGQRLQSEEAMQELITLRTEEEEARKKYIEAKQLQIEVKEGIRLLCQKVSIACAEEGQDEETAEIQRPASMRPNPDDLGSKEAMDTLFDNLKECMEHMANNGGELPEGEEGDENLSQAQSQHGSNEELTPLRPMGATSSSKTQAVPENNTRINFSEIGGDEDDEDESESRGGGRSTVALDDRVMDRETMKLAAENAAKLAAERAKKAKKEEEKL